MIVNKTQLAQIIGRSEEWLTQAQKQSDFPVLQKGRGRAGSRYETADVIDWMNRKNIDNLLGDAGAIDIEEAKRRKLAAEAALAETELAQVQGRLVEAEVVERAWAELVANCRAKLLSIPSKVSPEVFAAESLVEVKATMKSAITEALNELSNSEIDSERPESVRAAS
jgi:phage terminase Nu1 subunit (DNA packaging protein)